MVMAINIWGPQLWTILHKFGASAGTSIKNLSIDEFREITWLLNHLEMIVPCPECREHIKIYRQETGIPFTVATVAEWIWKFHNAVNKRLGKPVEGIEIISESSFLTKGKIIDLWKDYLFVLKDTISKGVLVGKDVQEWNRHFRLWIGFMGL